MKYNRLNSKLGIKVKPATNKANKAIIQVSTSDADTIPKEYKRKQPEASNDYTQAYNIVQSLAPGETQTATIDNKIRFRKYLYDLGIKQRKVFNTRMQTGNKITILRFS